jgi:hypothetical protein
MATWDLTCSGAPWDFPAIFLLFTRWSFYLVDSQLFYDEAEVCICVSMDLWIFMSWFIWLRCRLIRDRIPYMISK